MLTETEYQTFVTGYPRGVVYAVENPDTGDTFDFAGFADGRLVHTVASLYDAVQPDGSLSAETQEVYLGLASLQLKGAAGTPIRWVCQRPDDADALRNLLRDFEPELGKIAPLGSIEVIDVPAPDGSVDKVAG